jgi:hypothetical protein
MNIPTLEVNQDRELRTIFYDEVCKHEHLIF